MTEERAAILALPESARLALTLCEGPGWLLDPDGESFAPDVAVPLPACPNLRNRMAWLPASEGAILQVAADLGKVDRRRAIEWMMFKGYDLEGRSLRLAALLLLGEVSR